MVPVFTRNWVNPRLQCLKSVPQCHKMPQGPILMRTISNNTTVPSEPSEPREANGPSEPSGLWRAPSVSSCRILMRNRQT